MNLQSCFLVLLLQELQKTKRIQSIKNREYYLKNKDKLKIKHRTYHAANREQRNANKRANREHDAIVRRKRTGALTKEEYLKKIKKPFNFLRAQHKIYNRTGYLLRGKRKFDPIVGCTSTTLRNHLQFQFTKSMNWNNYGSYWVVDHIIPISKFNLEDPSQLKIAAHFTNLKPMERRKNILKSDKITKPTQPQLPLNFL